MVRGFNLDGTLYFLWVRFAKKSLAIPHISVPDMRKIDPCQLKEWGFEGAIFDKDSTLTPPDVNELYPVLTTAFSGYKEVFKDKMAILSDSAGTRDDSNYEAAQQIERNMGIAVLRHDRKKPRGGIESVLDYFGCDPAKLFIIGDRIFTDVVFGNRYGLLTIHTSIISEEGENKAASLVRRYESSLINKWKSKGICAPVHPLYCKNVLI